jgi:hypothetical protein
MHQMSLFPPPGAPTQPLSREVQIQALQLLGELLAAVVEAAAAEPIKREGDTYE